MDFSASSRYCPRIARKGRGGGPDGCGSVWPSRSTLVVLGGGFGGGLTTPRKGGRTLRAKDIAEEGTEVELPLAMGFHEFRTGGH